METFQTLQLAPAAAADVSNDPTQPLLIATASDSGVVVQSVAHAQASPWGPAKGGIVSSRGTAAASCLTWHPGGQQLLAIAWQNGGVALWDAAHGGQLQEDSRTHSHAVSVMAWHPGGTHFLTADVQGKVVLWEVTKQPQPQPRSSAMEQGATITHAVWLAAGQEGAGTPSNSVMAYAACSPGSGSVTLKTLDLQGRSTVVQDIGDSLAGLLHYRERLQLVAVTSSGAAIILAAAASSGSASEWSVLLRMKAATAGAALQVCWAGPHCLALANSHDTSIRLLQLDTDDNHVLDPQHADFGSMCSSTVAGQLQPGAADAAASIVALAYEPRQRVLAAASGQGRVFTFTHPLTSAHAAAAAGATASRWQPLHSFWVGALPSRICWGPTADVLVASCSAGLYVASRSPLQHKLRDGWAAVQVAPGRVAVQPLDGSRQPFVVETCCVQLAGVDVTARALLLHDGRRAEVHSISSADGSICLACSFEAPAPPAAAQGDGSSSRDGSRDGSCCTVAAGCCMVLAGDGVCRTAEGRVEVCDLTGGVRQSLSFDAGSQGQPALLDACGGCLAVLTTKGLVRVFDMSGSEATPHAGPGPILPAASTRAVQIQEIRVNCDGSMVCAMASSSPSLDSRLFVYSAGLNGPLMLDLSADMAAPRAACWDTADPRVMAVQTAPLVCGSSSSSCSDVALVFASDEAGLLLQEYQELQHSAAAGLLGVAAPHLLLLAAGARQASSALVSRVPLRCFGQLAAADVYACKALLDFSYHTAAGRVEEAFRAVAALQSRDVAQSMAHLAIKNKRLDVAEHFLGNMEHIRGARVLRESAAIPQLDARVGLVAVQLGLADDAARLFSGCERWDLLTELHAASCTWDAALQVTTSQDRVRLQAVHHALGRHCEAIGDLKAAATHYIASGAAATEVTRMLWESGDMPELEQHVAASDDPGLLTWWARTCEAQGQYAQAISCYQRAGNQLAVLRIHCATGDWEAAEQLVATTQDPAAAFHLARLHEAQDRVPDALRCYGISKRYSHAARLARRCGMDQELLTFALNSPPAVMLEAADHLAASGNAQAAAALYLKGGKAAKAVDMACAGGLVDVLESIAAGQLDTDSPELISRCAEAFLAAGRHEQAVRLLAKACQHERAVELLVARGVPLSDDLADALTPEKLPDNADSRAGVLLRIAQAAKAQGLFHLACKKFTQAGDRLRAARALIRSGDTAKVVVYAGVSRQREVYIMAANYLQSLNWRGAPELLNHILAFYTKAGAADCLANFYLSCAATELGEFKAYDKALQAMQEAAKHLAKSRVTDSEAQLAALQAAIDRVDRYVQARDLMSQDPAAAVLVAQALLAEVPRQQEAVPDVLLGDVFALLVEWCHGQGSLEQALQLVSQMMDAGQLAPERFISADVLAALEQAAGVQLRGAAAAAGQRDEEDLPCCVEDDDAAVNYS